LILSGDNAVVIGMAARSLSPRNRRRAIIFGGAGAIGLRILFTAMAALLLDVPYLQAAGGLLLLYIAFKLVKPQSHGEHVSEAGSLGEAIRTIVLADVVMSLDNILAVAASADGHLWLLLFGLALSIPLILFGSEMVARLLTRHPILVYVGAVVLVITAVEMLVEDRIVRDFYHVNRWELALLAALTSATVLLLGRYATRSRRAAGGDPLDVPVDLTEAIEREAEAGRQARARSDTPAGVG
jgi:YjbE family integral membrane protein